MPKLVVYNPEDPNNYAVKTEEVKIATQWTSLGPTIMLMRTDDPNKAWGYIGLDRETATELVLDLASAVTGRP